MTELIKTYTWKESYDMCQIRVCKWCSYDMDGSFCVHPKSLEQSCGYGLSLNAMISTGLCTGCNNDPNKNLRQLFEPTK